MQSGFVQRAAESGMMSSSSSQWLSAVLSHFRQVGKCTSQAGNITENSIKKFHLAFFFSAGQKKVFSASKFAHLKVRKLGKNCNFLLDNYL
jgi:hypothetical protein